MNQNSLEHRLDTLERQIRRYRAFGFVATLACLCSVLLGLAHSKVEDVPTVRGLRVAHPDGTEALFLGIEGGLPLLRMRSSNKPSEPMRAAIISCNSVALSKDFRASVLSPTYLRISEFEEPQNDRPLDPLDTTTHVFLGVSEVDSHEMTSQLWMRSPSGDYGAHLAASADRSVLDIAYMRGNDTPGARAVISACQSSEDSSRILGGWAMYFSRHGEQACAIGTSNGDSGLVEVFNRNGEGGRFLAPTDR